MFKNRHSRWTAGIVALFVTVLGVVGCGTYSSVQGQQLTVVEEVIGGQRGPGAVRAYLDGLPESRTETYAVAKEQFRGQLDPSQAVLDQVRKDIVAEYGEDPREVALATTGAFLSTKYIPNLGVYELLYDAAEDSGEPVRWNLLRDRAEADLKLVLSSGGEVVVLKR